MSNDSSSDSGGIIGFLIGALAGAGLAYLLLKGMEQQQIRTRYKCPRCGNLIDKGTTFCSNCFTKLEWR